MVYLSETAPIVPIGIRPGPADRHPILGRRRIRTSVVIAVETTTLDWARTVSWF
jgi:hypothetical protein